VIPTTTGQLGYLLILNLEQNIWRSRPVVTCEVALYKCFIFETVTKPSDSLYNSSL